MSSRVVYGPVDTVAVVGAGAVGLSAMLTTGLWGAARVIAVDTNKFRLEKALDFGATDTVEVGPNSVDEVLALTDGLGVDVAIEAVGYPETLLSAAAMVRPGGTVANVGVHGVPVELPMQEMWIQNINVTMGLVDTVSIPTLLKMVASGKIPSEKMGTHTFTLRPDGRGVRRVQERRGQPGAQGRHPARLTVMTYRFLDAMGQVVAEDELRGPCLGDRLGGRGRRRARGGGAASGVPRPRGRLAVGRTAAGLRLVPPPQAGQDRSHRPRREGCSCDLTTG